jgi:AcrR family transcriptional regulator
MATTGRRETRRAILNSAARVIRADGVAGLTLEAAAREAGVSKGGLLYHFPSKDALIVGMMADVLDRFEQEVERAAAADPEGGPGRWLRAFVRVTFTPAPDEVDMTAGLLAAVAADPALLEPVRAAFDRWQRRAEQDGLDPALATVIRLAADGVWFADLLDVAPLTGARRERALAALLDLTRAGTS